MRSAVDGRCAWRELTDQAASLTQQPAPTVIHFARFEQPFLRTLAAGVFPLDVVCTRDIARRLLPNLPRCSLRALAGYFGRAVGALRRSADHVEATAFVWHELGRPAREAGRVDLGRAPRLARRTCQADQVPTPRLADAARRAAFIAGCAWDLSHASDGRQRPVRRQGSVAPSSGQQLLSEAERRARAVARDAVAGTRDLVRRHTKSARGRAPRAGRNQAAPTALQRRADDFRTARCGSRRRISARVVRQPSPHCPLGPFASAETLDQFAALARAGRAALTSGSRGPDDGTFTAGYDRLCATHPELSRVDLSDYAKLLRLGTRLWREGRRDRDVDEDDANETRRGVTVWTPEFVQVSLEWLALRAALARRRAIWLTRLFDSSVVWREPGDSCARLIVIENGEVVLSGAVDANATPPIPPGYRRPVAARREAFTLASFDRLRVLTTELKRLIAAGAPVALRLGVGPALDESRLASALWWV